MKYTVVIQHPVQDEVRAELEQQLSQRLGLGASAAAKLAGRRSGRLLKPTTRPKAEKLLGIFSAVGAAVTLEEVPEEGELVGLVSAPVPATPAAGAAQPAASGRPASGSGADSSAANPFGMDAAGGSASADPFGAAPFSADPFGADPFSADPFGADPFGTAPFGTAAEPPSAAVLSVAGPSAPGPFAASQPAAGRAAAGRTQVFSAAPGGVTSAPASKGSAGAGQPEDEWASFTQGLGGADAAADSRRADESEDIWADFADALKVDVPAQPGAPAAPAPLASSFMDVAEGDAAQPVVTGPRRSLERQLLLTSLLPTAALSLLSLLLLSLLLPASKREDTAVQAGTLAQSLSATWSAADAAAVQNQLRTLVSDDEIAFVQVRLPGGPAYFASDAKDAQSQAMQQAFAQWQEGGKQDVFRSGGTYVVGQSGGGDSAAAAPQVAVGVPYQVNLSGVLVPWLLTSLVLLSLAALWARRAAQALLNPIQRLVRAADAISSGDLSQPVQAESNDEVGDLAQALERMRLSLSAAMDRLRKRKR
ncbi:HAMP domain-containing protein [Deinococcus sp. SL84]|uniref:HAMP domain-containing protein n=1 Tax=Deinococcus sp. SL84 TaxID=2994663 RepID=UPI002272EDE0|nr:HAMP domain-containing protein [Deinococcus sp. SL84]MCY1701842.1 HAMP domain-containing protein [Deinococcus sp. SL84]